MISEQNFNTTNVSTYAVFFSVYKKDRKTGNIYTISRMHLTRDSKQYSFYSNKAVPGDNHNSLQQSNMLLGVVMTSCDCVRVLAFNLAGM